MPNEEIEIALQREGASFYTQSLSSSNHGYIEFTVDPMSINLNESFNSPSAIYLRVGSFFVNKILNKNN
jgi:hypothetical protein